MIKKDVPESYIEELNEIAENENKYDAKELFKAYKRLWQIKDVFIICGQLFENADFNRLLKTLIRIEIKIEIIVGQYSTYPSGKKKKRGRLI